ncbi:hypothetical protein Dda_5095 [Drechslerella dactyloides]|uniref:Uncharacterized protein n=1 Tax=Drechslerella dactyloides TaxID=74499 RepID=A0AAD6IVF9_DREDA|nr:hypothetical protein Dda_5095 [Drechslerella dactyloides]
MGGSDEMRENQAGASDPALAPGSWEAAAQQQHRNSTAISDENRPSRTSRTQGGRTRTDS